MEIKKQTTMKSRSAYCTLLRKIKQYTYDGKRIDLSIDETIQLIRLYKEITDKNAETITQAVGKLIEHFNF